MFREYDGSMRIWLVTYFHEVTDTSTMGKIFIGCSVVKITMPKACLLA